MNTSEKMTNEAKPKRDKNQNIQVFVRVRPLNSQEKNSKCALVVDTPGSKEVNVTEKSSSTKTFSFDRVFGSNSKQVDVYKTVAAPLLQEVLNGYNCTVFCYGQTGTGKTFTMEGDKCNDPSVSWENDPLSGIIPRTLNNLFDELRIQEVECTVRVSFIELYNEDIYDLLSPTDDTTKLRLFEDTAKKGSVIIQGVEEVTVHNKDEVYQILAKGSEKRQTACTLLNAHSSRSHTIFSLTVHIKENTDDGEELMKIGKLNLVDLAGSENIGRSGAVDRRAREAGNINQSLLTLGRVITGLVERAPHIPYRESKLTRLLQDSLGGRTKTSIIATISPASCNVEETLSTLDYAHRARNITNRPEVNQKLTKRALLKEYTEEIERLRRDLLACREKTGIYLATENYTQIMAEADTQKREIVDKTLQLRAMEEELARKEEAFVNLQQVLARREEELTEKTKKLVHTKERLVKTHQEYASTCKDRDEKHHLVKAHLATERTLGDQAKKLLEVAQHSTQDLSKLHSKMDRKRSIEEENNRISHDFRQSFTQNLVRMEDRLVQFTQKQADFCKDMRNNLGERLEKRGKELTAVSEQMSSLVRSQGSIAGDLQKNVADQTQEGQKFLQTLIKNTRMESESQVASMQAFLMQSFLPKLQQISQNLLDESQTVVQMKKTLDQQLALQNEAVHTFVTEQREALSRVRADSQRLLLGQRESLQVINHLKKNIDQANAAKQADFSQYVSSIQALLVSMEKSQSAHDSQLVSGVEGLTVAIENQGSGLTDLGGLLDDICRDETQRSQHLETQHTSRASDLGEKISEYMDKHADSNLSATKLVEATETEMRGHVSNAQTAWQSLHTAQEAAVRTEMDSLAQGLKRHGALCQGMMSTVHAAAQTQETLLEDQRTDFTTYVREHQDDLEGRCSAVSDWATLMNAELRARDEDVHKFLTEDLRTELPTGKTPQRRDFQFPRFLAATSPHDRILERFRQTAKVEVPELDISLPERMALDEEMDVARLPAGSVPSSPVLKAPALPVRSSSLLNLQRDQEPLVKSESSQSLNSTSKENKENASEKSTGLNGSDRKREPKLPEARTSQNRKKALIPNN